MELSVAQRGPNNLSRPFYILSTKKLAKTPQTKPTLYTPFAQALVSEVALRSRFLNLPAVVHLGPRQPTLRHHLIQQVKHEAVLVVTHLARHHGRHLLLLKERERERETDREREMADGELALDAFREFAINNGFLFCMVF